MEISFSSWNNSHFVIRDEAMKAWHW